MDVTDGRTAKLTLGPLLFNWAPATWRDFYLRIADEAPVDTVHIGEVVCAKRAPFVAPHVAEVVDRLQAAGKEVVLSTLALIMNRRELQAVRETVATAGDLPVEANDVSAVAMLAGRPHVVGPFVNVYNEGTLHFLARNGAHRVCLPVELSAEAIATLAETTPTEIEVMVFGRLPLAISARCYHARHHRLSKDGCQFVCERDPDGLDLETLDGEPFLAVNGVQTLSYAYADLLGELDVLRAAGVGRFRLSPHSGDMVAVAAAFRGVLDGTVAPAEANVAVERAIAGKPMANGYFFGKPGVRFHGSLG